MNGNVLKTAAYWLAAAVLASQLWADEPDWNPQILIPYTAAFINVDKNVDPNDPTVPRKVAVNISWSGTQGLAFDTWFINFGDGTGLNTAAPPMNTTVTYYHEYHYPGIKKIEAQFPVSYPTNGWALTLVGPMVPYTPNVHLDPTTGAWPLTVNATLDEPAPGDEMMLLCTDNDNGPKFSFSRGSKTAKATFKERGVYTYKWSPAVWGNVYYGEYDVYALPQDETFQIVVEHPPLSQPEVLGIDHLSSLCSPWNEWNARMTRDRQALYFLSDRGGVPGLYMASVQSHGEAFGYPVRQNVLAEAAVPLCFEMAEDGSHLLCLVNNGWASPSVVRIELGPDNRPSSIGPVIIDGRVRRLGGVRDYNWTGPGVFTRPSDLVGSGEIYLLPGEIPFSTSVYRLAGSSPTLYSPEEDSTFELDQLPRLSSSDGRIRVWNAYEADCAVDRQWPVFATAEAVAGTSMYARENVQTEKERHLWDRLFEEIPACGTDEWLPVFLDQLTPDGSRLFFNAERSDSFGQLDLYLARLSSPAVDNQASITGWMISRDQ